MKDVLCLRLCCFGALWDCDAVKRVCYTFHNLREGFGPASCKRCIFYFITAVFLCYVPPCVFHRSDRVRKVHYRFRRVYNFFILREDSIMHKAASNIKACKQCFRAGTFLLNLFVHNLFPTLS
ncbi:hypothetical protein ES703_82509 [subsurface metagenome]